MPVVRRILLLATLLLLGTTGHGQAQQSGLPLRVGLIVPMTGPFASSGKLMRRGAELYMQQHGDVVAGRKIELIVKDDGGSADVGKRLAQELIVNDKVAVLAGFGLTPIALAVAPIATQAKVPMVLMMAAAAMITEKSPYIVRASFAVTQSVVPLADWAFANGIKSVVTVVSDYAPAHDVETYFRQRFEGAGGKILQSIRVPLANPDFAPFLQHVAEAKVDAMFAWVPAGVGTAFVRQYVERGLDKSGMKFIAEGSMTEDDIVNSMGDAVLGVITSQHYSAAHDSPENKAFVAAFRQANDGMRPNMMAMQGYDGMHMIYEGLKKTGGNADGDALVAAMAHLSWVSPRGPVEMDPTTREMIQNIYIRKVEKRDGELYNIEFATIPNFKDPSKPSK